MSALIARTYVPDRSGIPIDNLSQDRDRCSGIVTAHAHISTEVAEMLHN